MIDEILEGLVDVGGDLFFRRWKLRHFVWFLAATGVLILLVWLWLERSR